MVESDGKERSNIPSLVCAFMASLTTGATTYAFGLYGKALKTTLHLSQPQLDTISTAFFLAGLFSFIPGYCADRFGTRFSLSLGGILGATSLLSYWVVSRQFVVLPHAYVVPALSILGVAIFLSNALTTGSVFKIIVGNCGTGTKGSAVGVAKGYVGLGAGTYACLFGALRSPGESDLDFLPMAAFLAIVCATIPALCILPTKAQADSSPIRDEATPLHFRILYCSLLTMATLIVGNSIVELMKGGKGSLASTVETTDLGQEENDDEEEQNSSYGVAFLLVTIWLAPIATLMYLPRRDYREVELTVMRRRPLDQEDDEDEEVNLDDDGEGRARKLKADDDLDGSGNLEPDDSLARNRTSSGIKAEEEAATLLRRSHTDKGNHREHGSPRTHHKRHIDEEEADLLRSQLSDDVIEGDEDDSLSSDDDDESSAAPPVQQNLNLVEMLQTPTALLMLWTTTILVGAGTVETNNMGQMVEALDFNDKVTKASLALFSVAQAGARVATGSISESALGWNVRGCCVERGAPRPVFLVAASVIGCLAHFILGLATNEGLFVLGATLAGAAFGMVWPLMVLVIGEVFGPKNVGANYMLFDGFTSAIGTLVLSKFVAQSVYEEHINSHSPDPFTCIGNGCFRQTHMIVSVLSLSCVLTSLGTLYTSQHVYKNIRR